MIKDAAILYKDEIKENNVLKMSRWANIFVKIVLKSYYSSKPFPHILFVSDTYRDIKYNLLFEKKSMVVQVIYEEGNVRNRLTYIEKRYAQSIGLTVRPESELSFILRKILDNS